MALDLPVLGQSIASVPHPLRRSRPHAGPDGIHGTACPTRRHPLTADPAEQD